MPAGLEPSSETFSTTSNALQIRQYFSSPKRCLDCTLAQAHEREAYLRQQSANTIRELTLHARELGAAIPAICWLARTKNGRNGEPDGKLNEEDLDAIHKIEEEEELNRASISQEKGRTGRKVKTLWEDVRREWEGGIREVIKDDGTGEAEERCVFVMPWEHVPSQDSDADEEGKVQAQVQVQWVPLLSKWLTG